MDTNSVVQFVGYTLAYVHLSGGRHPRITSTRENTIRMMYTDALGETVYVPTTLECSWHQRKLALLTLQSRKEGMIDVDAIVLFIKDSLTYISEVKGSHPRLDSSDGVTRMKYLDESGNLVAVPNSVHCNYAGEQFAREVLTDYLR
jgi:hypothetical protein